MDQARAKRRLEIHRGRVSRTRYLLNQCLVRVQVLRAQWQETSDALMMAVDRVFVQQPQPDTGELRRLHTAMRQARDELGPAEAELDGLILRLDREQGFLEEEEEEFYADFEAITDDALLDTPLSPLREAYVPENAQLKGLDLENPLVLDFLEVRGQAEEVHERIGALEAKYSHLLEEDDFRRRHDMVLADDKLAFLHDFPVLRQSTYAELDAVERRVDELRRQCVAQGLFDQWEHYHDPHDAAIDDIYESIRAVVHRSALISAASMHPQHLRARQQIASTRDHVNQWLWECISTSALESLRFQHALNDACPALTPAPPSSSTEHLLDSAMPTLDDAASIDSAQDTAHTEHPWALAALQQWYTDDAGKEMRDAPRLSTMDAILAAMTDDSRSAGSSRGSFYVGVDERPMVMFA